MKRNVRTFAVAILAIGLSAATPAQDDPGVYEDGYGDGNFGRIRYLENGATIVRSGSEAGERFGAGEPSANSPIFPGDSIRAGRDQRVEVQLASGTILRLDRDGELAFQALPRSGAAYRDNTILSLGVGTLRVASREADDEDFRIDTPSSSVYVLGEADLRIDVDGSGITEVFSRRGVIEVGGEGGSVLVRAGMRTVVEPGRMPADPRPSNTLTGDGFDSWCDARDREYARREGVASGRDPAVYEDLPYEVRPYYGELSAYGSWAYVPTFGLVWYPSGVGADWRPYWDGYWSYGPAGYFWIASEPWGWAPHHFGRWTWVAGYGWCWVPGSVFGGAWVSWSWGSLYVGWAPLDFWNYPCIGGIAFAGYYDPYCWTFVRYDHFGYYRPYPRYAVPVSSVLPAQGGAAIVTRPPRVSPRNYATSAAARDRAVRQASEDRAARLPASRAAFQRTDEHRFVETERHRALDRRGPSSDPASFRRGPVGRQPTASAPSRIAAPGKARATGPAEPRAPEASASPRRSGEPTTGGFPRRYTRDPSRESGEERRPQAAPPTAGDDRPATREQLRNMYDRFSSRRETRPRQDPGETSPSRESAGPSRTVREGRPQAPAEQRANPRRPEQKPQSAKPPSASPRPQRPETSSRGTGQKRENKPSSSQNHREKARRR